MNPETYPYCQGDESNEAEIDFLADIEMQRRAEQQQVKKTPVCQTCKQPAKRLLLIKGIGHWYCEEHYDAVVVQRAEYAVSLRELHWDE